VPTEPPASRWLFPPPEQHDSEDDLIAVGADLEPGTLLAAYRAGLFPMRIDRRNPALAWWSPLERGILPLDGLHVSRSLRRSMRRYDVRVDTDFRAVVRGCADPTRPSGWIDRDIRAAYGELHRLGWAHSVEAWRDGELVGGLYGIAVGGLFAGESMFHRVRDASKVALVALVEGLADEHAADRLLDIQWLTPHLASLGAVEVSRTAYRRRLERALPLPTPGLFVGRQPER